MYGHFNEETKVWEGVKIPVSLPSNIHISEITMNELKKNPLRTVQISYDDNTEMNGEELRIKIIRVAQHLRILGIKDRNVVGLVCENSMELMAFVNGIIQIGAIVHPMSVEHSKEDLVDMFGQTKPKLVICDYCIYRRVQAALLELGNSAEILTSYVKARGIVSAEDYLLSFTGDEENYKLTKFKNPSSKILAILPSSGATGPAKCVCISQNFYLKFMALFPKQAGRSLSFNAIFWGSAFASLVLCPITLETRIVTRQRFTPELFFEIATNFKVTHFLMNPPKLLKILRSPSIDNFDVSNVEMVASMGGTVNEEIRKDMKKFFPNSHFTIIYALTEISCTMTLPGQPIEDMTVGSVAPNHLMKIVDNNGNALGNGEMGEILVKYEFLPFPVSKFKKSLTLIQYRNPSSGILQKSKSNRRIDGL